MGTKIIGGLLGLSTVGLMACSQGYNFDLPPAAENFGQHIEYNNKVDIVFMIDNSSSMSNNQNALTAAIPEFVNTLSKLKMDMHIAVVSSSMGGIDDPNGGQFLGSPRFLTSDTPNLADALGKRIQLGEKGSNVERGVDSLATVMDPNYLSNQGAGFWRDDALLVFIALSNEDDKSSVSPQQFVDMMNERKPKFDSGAQSWFLNFIGVLSLSGDCSTTNDYVEPGNDWIAIADATGGVKESLCAKSYATAASNIRERVVHMITDYKLSKKPVLESIVVRINGVDIMRNAINGWDYIEATNSIRFYGTAVPPANADIRIDFKPAEAN